MNINFCKQIHIFNMKNYCDKIFILSTRLKRKKDNKKVYTYITTFTISNILKKTVTIVI